MNVAQALDALGKTFRIEGNPTTEEEYYENVVVFVGVDDDQVVIESSNPDDLPTWGEVQAKIEELETEIPLTELRIERTRRLEETDWWALSDQTMTDDQIEYRQSLRDITENYTSLDNVVWPEKP